MAGRELDQYTLAAGPVDTEQLRRAAVHLADQLAAQHPTDYDESAPEYAGRLVAQDPTVATALSDLLDAIGYPTNRTGLESTNV
jgi:hypothetical protein